MFKIVRKLRYIAWTHAPDFTQLKNPFFHNSLRSLENKWQISKMTVKKRHFKNFLKNFFDFFRQRLYNFFLHKGTIKAKAGLSVKMKKPKTDMKKSYFKNFLKNFFWLFSKLFQNTDINRRNSMQTLYTSTICKRCTQALCASVDKHNKIWYDTNADGSKPRIKRR